MLGQWSTLGLWIWARIEASSISWRACSKARSAYRQLMTLRISVARNRFYSTQQSNTTLNITWQASMNRPFNRDAIEWLQLLMSTMTWSQKVSAFNRIISTTRATGDRNWTLRKKVIKSWGLLKRKTTLSNMAMTTSIVRLQLINNSLQLEASKARHPEPTKTVWFSWTNWKQRQPRWPTSQVTSLRAHAMAALNPAHSFQLLPLKRALPQYRTLTNWIWVYSKSFSKILRV